MAPVTLEHFKTHLYEHASMWEQKGEQFSRGRPEKGVFWQQAAKWQLEYCCNGHRNGEGLGPSAPEILHRVCQRALLGCGFSKCIFLTYWPLRKKRKKQTQPSLEGASLSSGLLVQINLEFWSHCICMESISIIFLCWKPLETECWKDSTSN